MSNPLRCLAVRELVVGKFLPVSQASIDVVEDVKVPLPSVETHKDVARKFRSRHANIKNLRP